MDVVVRSNINPVNDMSGHFIDLDVDIKTESCQSLSG